MMKNSNLKRVSKISYQVQKSILKLIVQQRYKNDILNYKFSNIMIKTKVIQQYALFKKIGQGQYSDVYTAEHCESKQLFAVKVMKFEKLKQIPQLNDFIDNQVQVLSRIKHKNIIQFIEIIRNIDSMCLIYQYCNGGTLTDLLKNKKLTENQVIKIFQQLRNGFQVLIKQKILHRDLKPSNILIHNSCIKIADFGFCKILMRQDDMTQTMLGSPIYMAPQVLKGLIYDCRADLWSLGVILFEMIYGYCPYEDNSIPKLISMIDDNPLVYPKNVVVSLNIRNLIKQLLIIRFQDRMQPLDFLQYPLNLNDSQNLLKCKNIFTFKQVSIFTRKMLMYIVETLLQLLNLPKNKINLSISYLIYKILISIQKNIQIKSQYWNIIEINNQQQRWDQINEMQYKILKLYGQMIKQTISQLNKSLKMKLELETISIDFMFYLELTQDITNIELKQKIYNCMLIKKHYINILDGKKSDWTDYTVKKININQRFNICETFARYN